ncbi:hypothetical protein [Streptomyces indiaensis]|uniref:Uncharacterized protein n=1 Tax=Streptomyces indiaensis TaxID=284033 RepID=A0ABN3EMN6_9ACTN|nr:hypothetical protein [Streptomyces indiaensis]MCF1648883.1 hypothetical protein [Streptomyces indiaensis]
MDTISAPTAGLCEQFDSETLALLDAVDDGIELPEFGDVDLDVVFGTPLELHERWLTRQELEREEAATRAKGGKRDARHASAMEWAARKDAARDIVAADPSINERVRERLLEALEPSIAIWIREELMGAARSVSAQLLRPISYVAPAADAPVPLAA